MILNKLKSFQRIRLDRHKPSMAGVIRATIDEVGGPGVTLAWQVENLELLESKFGSVGIQTTGVSQKWNALTTFVFDPEGHRIELWQPASLDANELE